LPKMAKAASSSQLSSAIEQHLEQTRGQVERLDRIFEQLGVPARGKKCMGMEGIIEEGKELLEMDLEEPTRDAGIIGAAQKVEHYEIAAYGTARSHAEQLGMDDAVRLLEETLEEEKQTDARLTELSRTINSAAQSEEVLEDGKLHGRSGGSRSRARTTARR
jgi:ferritin-like metal-binding protein YciE